MRIVALFAAVIALGLSIGAIGVMHVRLYDQDKHLSEQDKAILMMLDLTAERISCGRES